MSSKGRTSSSPLTQELTIKDGGWPAPRLSAVRRKALRVRKGQPWNPLADMSRRRETRPPSSAVAKEIGKRAGLTCGVFLHEFGSTNGT